MLQGTRDGCDSAHSSRGNGLLKTFFNFEQKSELIEDDEYYDSWYRGYIYCFHIVNKRSFSSIDAFMTPEHGWFWNKGAGGNPKVDWPFASAFNWSTTGDVIKPLQMDWHWNEGLLGNHCKGIFQC